MWKDFFYFSRREKQGILILFVLIVGVFIGKFLFTPQAVPLDEELPAESKLSEYETTKEEAPASVASDRKTYRSRSESYPPRQSYRSNPKQAKQPEARTYYPHPDQNLDPPVNKSYPKTEKLAEGTSIELNSSDTTQLMKIPGIGISFAKRIVGYRNVLGGYYRLEQLQEVYGMYEELYEKMIPYLIVNMDSIRLLPVNSASIDKLKSHPYINFYQAKAIIEIRKKKGKLKNVGDLNLLEEFTEEDLNRIAPYLGF
jgi:competence ComEA-like helix-hairpin-helix protein